MIIDLFHKTQHISGQYTGLGRFPELCNRFYGMIRHLVQMEILSTVSKQPFRSLIVEGLIATVDDGGDFVGTP